MFDELLEAVQRRFDRWVETRDVEDLLDPAGLRDAAALLALAPTPPPRRRFGFLRLNPAREATVAALQAAGMLRYARGLHLPEGPARDEEFDAATDLLNAVSPAVSELGDHVHALVQLAASPPPSRPPASGAVSWVRFAAAPLGTVGDAIAGTRRFVAAHPDDPSARMSLAELHELRFTRTGDVADIDAALAEARSSLERTPGTDPKRSNRLTALGLMLQLRFAVSGEQADLDAAIGAMTQAVEVGGPDHEDRSMYLSNLGRVRTLAYQLGGDPADLDAAVDALRGAVAALDPGEHASARGTRLGALATALRLRYERDHRPADLDEAFRIAQEAAEITAPHDHNATDRALDLAHTHLLRHQHAPDPADAAAAPRLAEQVLRTTADGDPDRERAQAIRDAVRRVQE